MVIAYRYDERLDRVEIATIRDGRSQGSPSTSPR